MAANLRSEHFVKDPTNNFKISNCNKLSSTYLLWAKLQNTPQLWSASLTCVGRLWRSRHNTIDAILIQWHVNDLWGILKLLPFMYLRSFFSLLCACWFKTTSSNTARRTTELSSGMHFQGVFTKMHVDLCTMRSYALRSYAL